MTATWIVRGNDPYLYGEKVKAYLRRGAKPIRGEDSYPNAKVGYGTLCGGESACLNLKFFSLINTLFIIYVLNKVFIIMGFSLVD
ncbi:MAG: hypothetical protein Q4D94_13940 [Bacillota bacterium]|nr:hypothetical protein [Bacillota bacterium]